MTTEATPEYPHACEMMLMMLADKRFPIGYSCRYRDYFVAQADTYGSGAPQVVQRIEFCPWCGQKLPSSLSEEWWVAVDAATSDSYSLGDPLDDLPQELQTDAWWRGRFDNEGNQL